MTVFKTQHDKIGGKMKYTLITSIGTGLANENKGYPKTIYSFPNGKEFETNIFLDAIVNTKYKEIEKIVLVGTVTSGWDMLVEDDENLFVEVGTAREEKQLTLEIFKKIEDHICKKYNIPILIKYHTDELSEKTSLEVFNLYNSIIPEISSEGVLLDITHGFRTMPVLLYQTLQFSVSQNPKIKDVEIVYGEYIKKEEKSYVRNLTSFWNYSQISDALSLFTEKLDGFKLAKLINKEWEKGSKAILRFSEIVQTNFALQILEVLKQLKNAVKDYPENAPTWLGDVKKIVEQIIKIIDKPSLSSSLFSYAQFLYEKKLNIQAIIALQVCVETFICEKENELNKIGNYDWWQSIGKECLRQIKNANYQNIGKQLNNLEFFRNQIAHGGAKNKDGKFPQASNIPNIYESAKRGVENLLKL